MEPQHSKNTAYYWVQGIIVVAVIAAFIYFNSGATKTPTDTASDGTSDTTAPTSMVSPYGSVTLKIGETANFRGISITPLKVEEDSRCAKDVQCVWAGTVKVSVRSDLASGKSPINMITLGQKTTVDTFSVGLTAVVPEKLSTSTISTSDYRLTFEVHQSSVVDEELIGK
ncbi:MAG: hypothetical protein RLZZ67_361 [Candidatus Parcubacteria bacterium]|jgi:hypothetical protein